jgi:catechol 2,3-dioxygenase-like lactoylglutathione lyase family enzyme
MELDHVVLEVESPQRSIEFYRSVLHLEAVREAEFSSDLVPFPSLRVSRGTVIDLFPARLWSARRKANPNHICLTMSASELAALRRRLRDKTIPILRESRRNFGARGYARSIYFRDPDGIMLEARYYPVARRRRRTKG